MDLKQLQAMGAFVPPKLIKRDITVKRPIIKPQEDWTDPEIEETTGELTEERITVYLRKGASVDAIEAMQADKRAQLFVPIFRCVCNADGTPLFESLEQAMQLQLWLAAPLLEAISEVAGNVPKSLRRKTSSGAKSHSLSADVQSTNGSTPSTRMKKRSGASTQQNTGR